MLRLLVFVVVAFSTLAAGAYGQTAPLQAATQPSNTSQPSAVVRLWEGAVPGALGSNPAKDIPTLTLFPAPTAKATGAAMIICPGGGYGGLATSYEGNDYAVWLGERGITGLVLKYRLGSAGYRHPVMMEDIQRAIRLARYNAKAWNIDPKRIGVMGSSAGGHLASTALTHFDAGQADSADPVERESSRPDLGVLCYAVITMGPLTHMGSRMNLLGKDPSPELITLLSSELQVTKDTPPCFIWSTADDRTVSVQNSLLFAAALSHNHVTFELHIYPHGPHGQGLGVHNYVPGVTNPEKLLPWTRALEPWLKLNGFSN